MNWTKEELLAKLSDNPDVKIEDSQLPVKASSPSLAHPSEPKPHKYHVAAKEDRTYNGIVYQSKKEAEFIQELDLEIKAGVIDFYLTQVCFRLPGVFTDKRGRHRRAAHYLDAITFKRQGQLWDVHFRECKGRDLPMGKLKRTQVEALYPVKVEII